MILEKVDKTKYYCLNKNRWVEEYLLFGKIRLYKLLLFQKRPRWSIWKSKKPMYDPVLNKVRMLESEAIKKWGHKWNWPKQPYIFIKDEQK